MECIERGLKGTVSVISSDLSSKEVHVGFTTVSSKLCLIKYYFDIYVIDFENGLFSKVVTSTFLLQENMQELTELNNFVGLLTLRTYSTLNY